MLLSWIYVAVDLFEAGVFPGGAYWIVSTDWPKTGSMIYRQHYMYQQLVKRRPDWCLPPVVDGRDTIRIQGERALRRVKLPNGSYFEGLTAERPESLIQEGARRVRLEEVAKFPYPAITLQNARMMCQPPKGIPGLIGGNVTMISTVMPGWFREQRKAQAETVQGFWPAWSNQ